MERTILILLLVSLCSVNYAQCEPKPVEFILNDITDTVIIEGICGNVLGSETYTPKLDPKDFSYMNGGTRFVIKCEFAKNCGQGGFLTVRKFNDSIVIKEGSSD